MTKENIRWDLFHSILSMIPHPALVRCNGSPQSTWLQRTWLFLAKCCKLAAFIYNYFCLRRTVHRLALMTMLYLNMISNAIVEYVRYHVETQRSTIISHERHGVWNYRHFDYLFNNLFSLTSKKIRHTKSPHHCIPYFFPVDLLTNSQ